jgi:hypothetical protein
VRELSLTPDSHSRPSSLKQRLKSSLRSSVESSCILFELTCHVPGISTTIVRCFGGFNGRYALSCQRVSSTNMDGLNSPFENLLRGCDKSIASDDPSKRPSFKLSAFIILTHSQTFPLKLVHTIQISSYSNYTHQKKSKAPFDGAFGNSANNNLRISSCRSLPNSS